jgi:hypothetical protein
MLYGDFSWWVGVVEDRDDPMKVGRYRVRILGYHIEDKSILPTKDLPWATTVQPVGSAAISGIGHDGTGLVTGTTVIGFFADGSQEQMPIVFGSLGGIDFVKGNSSSGFTDPNGVYPKSDFLEESSLSRLARGGDVAENHVSLGVRRDMRITGVPMARPDEFEGINDAAPTVKNKSETSVKDDDGKSVPAWDEPRPQGLDESVSVYPYNKVRETEGGHVFEVDDTPENKRILNYHSSGSHEEYHHNGSHVQKIVGDDFEIVYKDKTLYVEGDLTLSVKGDVNMKVDGNKIEDIGGDLYQTIRGGRFVKVQKNDVLEVISDQKVNIDGQRYTVIGCATSASPISIPLIGTLTAGRDYLTVKGGQVTQVGGRKTETVGGVYTLSAVAGMKMFSSLGSFKLLTLKTIDIATGLVDIPGAEPVSGGVGAISFSTGQLNMGVAANTNIITGGILTMTTTGAMAVTSAAAAYTHAATSFTTAVMTQTTAAYTITAGGNFSVAAPIISLN